MFARRVPLQGSRPGIPCAQGHPSAPAGRSAEAGAVLVAVALFLLLLIGFAALGTEAGRWFLVRAELSKSVDAAALVGAKNISNPNVDVRALASEFCTENFQGGHLGTGSGTANFNVQLLDEGKVRVDGAVSAPAILAKAVGMSNVAVSAAGVAQMRKVEIMLILDRSGSMSGKPIADLKVAAKSFLDFFVSTQDKDKMGLISFATAARVDRPLGTNYVSDMKTAIDGMSADGYTNSEDAIDQADGPLGFTDQSGLPGDARVQQFLIFFSDGRANTFRWTFKYKNVDYDAVTHCNGDCDPGESKQMDHGLWSPVQNQTAFKVGGKQVPNVPTGDGVLPSRYGATRVTTRWNVFDTYPVPGYPPDAYNLSDAILHDQVCSVAAQLAILHAQEMKDTGVVVFVIGLGTRLNNAFLDAVASSPEQVYLAPTSDDLQALFQKVAQDIKLRLVQ